MGDAVGGDECDIRAGNRSQDEHRGNEGQVKSEIGHRKAPMLSRQKNQTRRLIWRVSQNNDD
jgi:hypothetical protein